MIDRVGQQLGNYRLIRLLGRGGFAEVYLGEHVRLSTHAAVKVLYTRLANPHEAESFEKEARTIAHLNHPHIVRIFDFDLQDDTPFLVMDYAPNGSLRQHHPKGTILPLTTIVSYVKQVADALQYAHDQRLIHRDVKPENMLLGQRNELLLSDFGIAIVAQSSRYQSTQEMAGTMAYMAPEQIQGKPRPASDQYSLGIVVYEWLSGDRPFHGHVTEIVAQHLAVPPPSLLEKVPTVSADVEQVVLKALKKDPHQRFGSVREFAQALVVEQTGSVMSTIEPTVKATPLRIANPIPQKTKKQWLDEGDTHYDAGRYKEAITAYSWAIRLDSQDARVYFNRGNAYVDLEEYEQAIADYTSAIALDSKYVDAYFNRGEAYTDLEEYEQAIADYTSVIALDSKYALAYSGRGLTYNVLEEYEQAIADYTSAIALDPKYALAYSGRGLTYNGLNDYRRAIQDYDQALQLNSNITWVIAARNEAYQRLESQR